MPALPGISFPYVGTFTLSPTLAFYQAIRYNAQETTHSTGDTLLDMNEMPGQSRTSMMDQPSQETPSLSQQSENHGDQQPTMWDPYIHPDSDPASSVTIRSAVKELLETAIYILLVFVIVRSMVQNFKIEGSSMEPTLHSEQYILVNKLVYFHFDLNAPLRLLPGYETIAPKVVYPLSLPKRGDVIVFEYPNDIRKDYIKRVIGVAGDRIQIQDGTVYLNGKLLNEEYLTDETMPENLTFCNPGSHCYQQTVVVPEGNVFVMGDNRGNSSDSREWNALAIEHIIGKAWVLYYPLDDLGMIDHHSDSFK
jgi:signal peptidase I